jgi:uncharacterized protein (TIGR00369 family)
VELTFAQLAEAGAGLLPGHLGIEIDSVDAGRVAGRMTLGPQHMAPNGYLHAAAVVGLADTACGYGCILGLPEGAVGFTTIELKTNFLRTAQEGTLSCERSSPTAAARRRSGMQPSGTRTDGRSPSSAAPSSSFAERRISAAAAGVESERPRRRSE